MKVRNMPLNDQDNSIQRRTDNYHLERTVQKPFNRLLRKNLYYLSLDELLDQEYRSMMQLHHTKQSLRMLSVNIPDGIEAQ